MKKPGALLRKVLTAGILSGKNRVQKHMTQPLMLVIRSKKASATGTS